METFGQVAAQYEKETGAFDRALDSPNPDAALREAVDQFLQQDGKQIAEATAVNPDAPR